MSEDKKYYAIYTGDGDGIVIHSTWNNIEAAVNDLLNKNPKAKKHAFADEAEAKNFARHGFDPEEVKLLLANERFNKKVDQAISNLTENEVIAFIAGSHLQRENKAGYGAIIFTNRGLYYPKELCDSIVDSQNPEKVAAQHAIEWAIAHHKSNITLYYNCKSSKLEHELVDCQNKIALRFESLSSGKNLTHYNEASRLATAGARGIEKN